MEDEYAKTLIEDPDEALRRWYQNFMAPAGHDNVLTGGPIPSMGQIGDIFDRWADRRRDDLRAVLCDRLGYAKLESNKRETLEIGTVAIIATALLSTHLAGQIDPVATAVVMISRRSMDRLCGEI